MQTFLKTSKLVTALHPSDTIENMKITNRNKQTSSYDNQQRISFSGKRPRASHNVSKRKSTKQSVTCLDASNTNLVQSSLVSSDSNSEIVGKKRSSQMAVPIARSDEPNIYNLPQELSPSYRDLPLVVRLALAIPSVYLAAISTFEGSLIWLKHLLNVAGAIPQYAGTPPELILPFLLKTCLIFLAANIALQEVLASPSRISTQDLVNRHFLPSRLSNYETVNLPDGQSLGVHSLQYDSPTTASSPTQTEYSALYLNHGFGASSLSWLPAIPKLTKRLKVKKTLAHDAVGFGFTDRPDNVELYNPNSSSEIGIQILNNNKDATVASGTNDDTPSSVMLMGHSMGSYATLEMALKIPEDVPVTVVLVAPALCLLPRKEDDLSSSSPTAEFLQSKIVGPQLHYLLRRLVGVNDFWKKGLQHLAWDDPALVSDSDALRYQWPSIGEGWEQGLMRYARAMSGVSNGEELLKKVANRPNTRIAVVLGEKDKIISRSGLEKLFDHYPGIPMVEVKGCGHDPFEEKTDAFVDLIDNVLRELPYDCKGNYTNTDSMV